LWHVVDSLIQKLLPSSTILLLTSLYCHLSHAEDVDTTRGAACIWRGEEHLGAGLEVLELLVLGQATKGGAHAQAVGLAEAARLYWQPTNGVAARGGG
jgi:hypothetical protein